MQMTIGMALVHSFGATLIADMIYTSINLFPSHCYAYVSDGHLDSDKKDVRYCDEATNIKYKYEKYKF